MNKELGIKVR